VHARGDEAAVARLVGTVEVWSPSWTRCLVAPDVFFLALNPEGWAAY
jgi:hypothetical protein